MNIETLTSALAVLPAADRKLLLAKLSAANAIPPETEKRIKRALNGLASVAHPLL
jgi:hypothetical protein